MCLPQPPASFPALRQLVNSTVMQERETDCRHMRRALELAAQGRGCVEPNPMVGCVIARGAEVIGEGWHRRFGGPHAEIEALRLAGPRAAGGHALRDARTVLPPGQDAALHPGRAGGRASAAWWRPMRDPFPQVRRRRHGRIARPPASTVEVGPARSRGPPAQRPLFEAR